MNSPPYLLDTSAILAHYFDEPGAETVASIWGTFHELPRISAISIAELHLRLSREECDSSEIEAAMAAYVHELTVAIPVDRIVAEMAVHVAEAATARVPLVDLLIAASARACNATLVHKDPHFSAIPSGVLEQLPLG